MIKLVCTIIALLNGIVASAESPWPRYTIDASSRGADGARLADVNGDGLPDVVTPWEEGGAIRIAFHPGHAQVREPWPVVEIGRVGQPEDAMAIDLDGDGQLDVVSACEGDTRSIYVHWAPTDKADLMNPEAWTTEILPASKKLMQFMFTEALDVNQDGRVDLVTGAKNEDAMLGWFESPENPRALDNWTWHPIAPVGWIMSIRSEPRGPSNSPALLVSDRRGTNRGVYRVYPEGDPTQAWTWNRIGGENQEVMFMDYLRYPPNRWAYAWGVWSEGAMLKLTQRSPAIQFPKLDDSGGGKGVALGDLNEDGLEDLAVTCEHADGKYGVFYYAQPPRNADVVSEWTRHDIGGIIGTKFDRIELIDLDNDGDLDLLTCEEKENLGVIWYENPR